jgi:hypothetical protein
MMVARNRKRRKLFVDRQVQGALLLRAAGYWLFCLLTVSLMVLCWGVLTGPRAPASVILGRLLSTYTPALVASLVLLPMVLVDCNRFSNRFVGPLLRLRRNLRQLADGEQVRPIGFRDKDYWQDLADSFNGVLARIQSEPPGERNITDTMSRVSTESPGALDEPEPVAAC